MTVVCFFLALMPTNGTKYKFSVFFLDSDYLEFFSESVVPFSDSLITARYISTWPCYSRTPYVKLFLNLNFMQSFAPA